MEKERLRSLVEKAKAKDEQALYELYEECFSNVYYLALRMMKNTQDAEDITQETFLAVWKNIGTLMEPDAFFGWVNLIAANKCREFLRKKGIPLAPTEDETVENLQVADLDEALLPQSALDNEETRRLVLKIVDSLPEAQRMCVLLYYYQGMSVEQVAGAMECSVGTVKSRLSAARTKIRVGIETFEEEEGVRLHAIGLLPFFLADAKKVNAGNGLQGKLFEKSLGRSDVNTSVEASSSGTDTSTPRESGNMAGNGAKKGFSALSGGAKAGIIAGAVVLVAGLAVGIAALAGAFGGETPVADSLPVVSSSMVGSSSVSASASESEVETQPVAAGGIAFLTDMEFMYASEFYNGYAYAVKGDACGYIDTSGNFTELYALPDDDFLYRLQESGPDNVVDFALTASENGIVPYYDSASGLWGYADIASKAVTIEPQYAAAYPFRHGAAVVVTTGGSRSAIDVEGAILYDGNIAENYFRYGLVTVAVGEDAYQIINVSGQVVYPQFTYGGIQMTRTANTSFFADVDSAMLYKGFSCGDDEDMLRVEYLNHEGERGLYYDFINRSGAVVATNFNLEEERETRRAYEEELEELLSVSTPGANQGGSGMVFMAIYYGNFYEGVAFTYVDVLMEKTVVDKNLEPIVTLEEVYSIWDMYGGMMAVSRFVDGETLKGFLNADFEEVIPPQYTNFQRFADGIAGVQQPDGLWGAIDTSGNTLIPFEWAYIGRFVDGVACAKKTTDGQYCFIDTAGNVLLEEQFYNVYNAMEGVWMVMEEQPDGTMRYGFLQQTDV